jgi:hypothetical protein
MRKLFMVSAFSVLFAASAFSQVLLGKHKIELSDPAGDVRNDEGKPGKDVVKVSIASDGKSLHVIAELKENAAFYLTGQMAGPVIEMHFDTDNNERTGGIPFWGRNRKGYEYQVNLVACIKYKDGMACLGALGGEITGFRSSYAIYRYAQGEKMPKSINDAIQSTQKDIAGKQVEITLPYSAIGIKSGGRMRIAIRESDSSFDDASYFPPVFFMIK